MLFRFADNAIRTIVRRFGGLTHSITLVTIKLVGSSSVMTVTGEGTISQEGAEQYHRPDQQDFLMSDLTEVRMERR